MSYMKEASTNQVLSLIFTSAGSDAVIGFSDIDTFFDILKRIRLDNERKLNYSFGINMPMHDNFDLSLFEELKEGPNKGKFILVKTISKKELELKKHKLIRNIYKFAENDRDLLSDCRQAIKEFNKVYNKETLEKEIIERQKSAEGKSNLSFKEKIKQLAKRNNFMI